MSLSSNGGSSIDTLEDPNLSRADFVYQRLMTGIRSGEFKPGDRLREAELADRLNVSRTPIREAIRRLASVGLVEVAPSRGVMIIQLDKQQVREMYSLREALESAAARLAAQHADESDVVAMRRMLGRMSGETSASGLAKLNRTFHQAIHEAAHNRYLALSLSQLADWLALLPGTTFEVPERRVLAQQEHAAMVDAIEARNADEADRIARLHIRAAGQVRTAMMFERS